VPILLLIRHATNDFVKTGRLPGQTPNIHLNDEGRGQAEALGRLLAGRALAAVYSSHLERALETAWRVAAPRGLAIIARPDLADTHAGDYGGKAIKELAEAAESKDVWKTIVETPSQGQFPNGESLAGMQRRVVAALERICAAHPDPEPPQAADAPPQAPPIVAVVAHADVIKAALAHYLGMPLDNFQRLAVLPASVSAVLAAAKHTAVLNVNQIPYEPGVFRP
jgi:probable phosphoglycerate mutase